MVAHFANTKLKLLTIFRDIQYVRLFFLIAPTNIVIIRENMIRAFNENTSVCGIKGPSALMNLSFFDLANGMVPDYMHLVLLGVIRQHTELLLSSTRSLLWGRGTKSKINYKSSTGINNTFKVYNTNTEKHR